jgi:hypothetical protein
LTTQFTIDVANSRIEVYRNPLTTTLRIFVDGSLVVKDSMLWPFKRVRSYQFAVGQHRVVVEHQLPAFYAEYLPQTYRFFVDGKLVQEKHTY